MACLVRYWGVALDKISISPVRSESEPACQNASFLAIGKRLWRNLSNGPYVGLDNRLAYLDRIGPMNEGIVLVTAPIPPEIASPSGVGPPIY